MGRSLAPHCTSPVSSDYCTTSTHGPPVINLEHLYLRSLPWSLIPTTSTVTLPPQSMTVDNDATASLVLYASQIYFNAAATQESVSFKWYTESPLHHSFTVLDLMCCSLFDGAVIFLPFIQLSQNLFKSQSKTNHSSPQAVISPHAIIYNWNQITSPLKQ